MFPCKKCEGWKTTKQGRCKAPCPRSESVSISRFVKKEEKEIIKHEETCDDQSMIENHDLLFEEKNDETYVEIFERHVKVSKCTLSEREKEILRIPFDDPTFASNDGYVNHFVLMFGE